jgi:hypothetical protein
LARPYEAQGSGVGQVISFKLNQKGTHHMILLMAVSMMVLYMLIIVGGLCYIGQRWRRTSP